MNTTLPMLATARTEDEQFAEDLPVMVDQTRAAIRACLLAQGADPASLREWE